MFYKFNDSPIAFILVTIEKNSINAFKFDIEGAVNSCSSPSSTIFVLNLYEVIWVLSGSLLLVEICSSSKLAEKTEFSAKHLNLLARKGMLRAYKEGRNWYSSLKALDDYRKSRLRKRDFLG